MGLGEADLAADLGVGDEAGLLYARSRVVGAARAAGLPRSGPERLHARPRPRRTAPFHRSRAGRSASSDARPYTRPRYPSSTTSSRRRRRRFPTPRTCSTPETSADGARARSCSRTAGSWTGRSSSGRDVSRSPARPREGDGLERDGCVAAIEGVEVYRPGAAALGRDTPLAEPSPLQDGPHAPPRRHGPRGRQLRRERDDLDRRPHRYPRRRPGPRLLHGQSCTAASRRRKPSRVAASRGSAWTPSSRWSAAACFSTWPACTAWTCCPAATA